MEDALKKLDKLTHEEARMAIAQNLKATYNVDERVRGVANAVEAVDDRVRVVDNKVAKLIDRTQIQSGKQLRESIYKWLSPPDPSENHNIARGTHHKKMATWFFQGRIYQEWKSNGSLLWVHGKRSSFPAFLLIPSDRIL